jgi:hypothetical protein
MEKVMFGFGRNRVNADAGAAEMPPQVATKDMQIGDEMEDGTILAGYYEGRPLYAAPRDAPGTYTFNEAVKYASRFDAHGHHDFHAPSEGELNVLFENRNRGKLKGTFNETGALPGGWYWSSTSLDYDNAAMQRFNRGSQLVLNKLTALSLRLVR